MGWVAVATASAAALISPLLLLTTVLSPRSLTVIGSGASGVTWRPLLRQLRDGCTAGSSAPRCPRLARSIAVSDAGSWRLVAGKLALAEPVAI
jgi:hypothetical protein